MVRQEGTELRLDAPESCAGGGLVSGRLYYVDGDLKASENIEFGEYHPDMRTSSWLISQALEVEGTHQGKPINPWAVVALDAVKNCVKDRHDDEPIRFIDKPQAPHRRIERFLSLFIVENVTKTEPLRPLRGSELAQAWNQNGVTEVRRHNFDSGGPLRALLLPLTAAEERHYGGMNLRATKAAATLKVKGLQPDIMLVLHPKRHGQGSNIEELRTAEELR